jgi:hypothetical protein
MQSLVHCKRRAATTVRNPWFPNTRGLRQTHGNFGILAETLGIVGFLS